MQALSTVLKKFIEKLCDRASASLRCAKLSSSPGNESFLLEFRLKGEEKRPNYSVRTLNSQGRIKSLDYEPFCQASRLSAKSLQLDREWQRCPVSTIKTRREIG